METRWHTAQQWWAWSTSVRGKGSVRLSIIRMRPATFATLKVLSRRLTCILADWPRQLCVQLVNSSRLRLHWRFGIETHWFSALICFYFGKYGKRLIYLSKTNLGRIFNPHLVHCGFGAWKLSVNRMESPSGIIKLLFNNMTLSF